jgi:hypothetical protein
VTIQPVGVDREAARAAQLLTEHGTQARLTESRAVFEQARRASQRAPIGSRQLGGGHQAVVGRAADQRQDVGRRRWERLRRRPLWQLQLRARQRHGFGEAARARLRKAGRHERTAARLGLDPALLRELGQRSQRRVAMHAERLRQGAATGQGRAGPKHAGLDVGRNLPGNLQK